MSRPKKILNDPANVVTELLDGLVAVSDGRLTRLGALTAVIRADLAADKVALVIGGGSGHEPMFAGFVGEGLADGAACGEVAVLYNDLGSTTQMEMLIVARRVHTLLADAGIAVYRTEIGAYLTCQEMAGMSVTLLKLDDELKTYLDRPAHAFAYQRS